ncbi:tyrosine-type recombinase/integrase [Shumkonia mesophila]|uniref:tyrosine-type recombinase/integrase n=1 Tax=Shumkonia mesophila TaxID=2838854 RepID=UPI002934A47B|nr:tyrosine-type recombinase/integrase [Shumkonia mesophila]
MKENTIPIIPFADWPEDERARWAESRTVARWSKGYARRVARGYGRFLAFLETGTEEIISSTIDDYEFFLASRFAASSVASYLVDLYYALCVVHPNADWLWLWKKARLPLTQPPKSPPPSPVGPRRHPGLDQWSPEHRQKWQGQLDAGPRLGTFKTRKERNATSHEADADKSSPWSSVPLHLLTPVRRKALERGWCRWLAWVRTAANGQEMPAPETLNGFVATCERRKNSPVTIATYVGLVYRVAAELWPEVDWRWLKRDWLALENIAEPSRDKWAKFVPIDELCELGIQLMVEAIEEAPTPRTATKFRDGYLIAFLALRPKRVSNIAEIEVGINLAFGTDGLPNQLWWPRTKNGDESSLPYPTAILGSFHRLWWDQYRPKLMAAGSDERHLWIGRFGRPLSPDGIWRRVTHWTRKQLGRAVGPHAFRTNYATSMAIEEGRLLPFVRVMLDHRDPRSIAHYQLISESFKAGRALDEAGKKLIEAVGPKLERNHRRPGRPLRTS